MHQQNNGLRNQTIEKKKADIVSAFCISPGLNTPVKLIVVAT